MSTILDTQYFLINRDGYDYKVNALTLGQWVAGSDTKPWEEHIENGSGGVFHIINLTDDILYLSSGPYGSRESYGSFGPHQAYSIKGEDLGNVCSVPPLEEVVILTSENACGLFANNPNIEWKFGPETNTTHVTNMEFMFHNCALFNADITDWNTGFVTNMDSMFNGTNNFNQDLSQWCVSLIRSKPDRFDKDAIEWTGSKPGWGTCPRGENVVMPWEGHDGGIWHIQNLRGKDLEVNGGWAGSRDPVQVYAMDGTDLGMMQVIPQTLGEFIILSNGNESCLFNGGWDQDKFQFDFGPLTDTSKVVNFIGLIGYNPVINPAGMENFDTSNVICMHGTFEYCTAFDRDISGWDTSSVIPNYYQPDPDALGGEAMHRMFFQAHAFNKDLSGWCVTNLTSAPLGFADDTPAWTLPKPVWGTCPRGEKMPWEGHDGGIWHITNVTGTLKLKESYTSWLPDGTDEKEINEVNPGEEVVFITPKKSSSLFKISNTNAEYEIGPLTNTTAVTNMKSLFENNEKFKGVGVEYMDVSNVTTMELMFNVAEVFNGDVSGWNTSNVTNTAWMFNGSNGFNQDIGGWDMSKCEWTGYMFTGATVFNQDIGGWDTSKVDNMHGMFWGATVFNQDLSQWCVINVVDHTQFDEDTPAWVLPRPVWGTCPRGELPMPWEGHDGGIWHIKNSTKEVKLQEYNGPYQAWTINGDDLGEIAEVPMGQELVFITGANVSELFELNLDVTWDFGEYTDTSRVIDMEYMFYKADKFNSDISGWDTSNVTNMTGMFGAAAEFNQNIGGWNVSSVIGAYYMFTGASVFNQDLSGWCVPDIDDEPNGFAEGADAWVLPKPVWGTCPPQPDRPTPPNGPISQCTREPEPMPWEGHNGGIWHIRNVTGALAALGRTYQDETVFTAYKPDGTPLGVISKIDIGEEVILLTDPAQVCLFWGDGANTQAKYELGPLTDTSKVTSISRCFQYNKNFKGVGVEYMDTSNVTNMNSVFYECRKFNVDVSGWDTSKVTNTNSLFRECRKFNQDVSGWDVSKVNDMQSMFSACVVFNQDVSGWDTSSVGSDPVSNDQHMDNVFNSATSFNQDLSQWCTSNLVREPRGFDYGTEDTWTLPKPVWFTCPPRP